MTLENMDFEFFDGLLDTIWESKSWNDFLHATIKPVEMNKDRYLEYISQVLDDDLFNNFEVAFNLYTFELTNIAIIYGIYVGEKIRHLVAAPLDYSQYLAQCCNEQVQQFISYE